MGLSAPPPAEAPGNPARMPDPSALRRSIPALDGIRGLAIVWVVLHNALAGAAAPSSPLLHALLVVANPGWIGVQLFFALSGFLITGGLLDARGTRHYFRDFYARRALRILPLYYMVLLVLLPWLASLGPPYSNQHQAPLWLFTANWAASLPYGFGHFWSLAVEEQFYLIWPLLTYGLPASRMLKACLWIAVGALLLRCVLAAYDVSAWTLYANTACRMDALALGGAGACAVRVAALRQRLLPRLQQLGALAPVVFLVGIPLTHFYAPDGRSGATLGYSLLAFSSAAFVVWAALSDPARVRLAGVLTWAPLRSCGKYSYAMYVFHNLLHKLLGEPWLARTFGAQPPSLVVFGYALALLLVSYLLAVCSYHALELHFLRLKGTFAPRSA